MQGLVQSLRSRASQGPLKRPRRERRRRKESVHRLCASACACACVPTAAPLSAERCKPPMSSRALLWLSLAAALVALLLLLLLRPGTQHRPRRAAAPQPTCSFRDVLLPPPGRRDAACPLQTPKYSHLDHVLLGGLLVVSVAWALAEVCRDRFRATDKVIGEAGVPGVEPGRRCSLADLTVIRHARRESVQLMEAAGRTVPRMAAEHGPRRNSYIGVRPPLQRRSSFPAQLVSHLQKQASLGDGPRLSRRTSVDLSEEDSSPDTRRRVRMLRRH